MAKCFITGIAGFIGSHLAEKLARQGNEVFGIDNLSTGREENLGNLPKDAFVRGDCCDEKLTDGLVQRCDVVFHLAASVGVKLFVEEPVEAIEGNLRSTVNILRLAGRYKKKIFLASSSEVYGKGDNRKLKEEDDLKLGMPEILRWGYGCTKLSAEYLGLGYYKKKGLKVVIGRFFNVCGPRQTGAYGMVMPRFINAAMKNEPINVFGDGRQTRSFIYVDDVADAAIKLTEEEKAEGRIFNIGYTHGITINQLAETVKRVLKSNSVILHVPYKEVYGDGFEDIFFRVPDTSKTEKIIGFKPGVKLEEMIARIADYWKGKVR